MSDHGAPVKTPTIRKVRIVYVVLSLEMGGLEKLISDLILGLNRSRYEIYVCCLDSEGVLSGVIRQEGIKVFFVKRREGIDWRLIVKLFHFFRKYRFDVVHLNNSVPFFYGAIAAKLAQIPVIIYTEHGKIFPEKRSSAIVNFILSLMVDKVVVVCEYLRKSLIKYEGISNRKIVTIVNGVKIENFSVPCENIPVKHIPEQMRDDRLVGVVARLALIKNHQNLIRAIKNVVCRIKNIQLLIIGEGQERCNLEALVTELRLNEHVQFLGLQTNIPYWLSQVDVLVLPSLSEGLSLTILEAMAASKPVIATDVGGNPELVIDNVTGFLVPSNDPQLLAEKITSLLLDKTLAKRMGEEGFRRVSNNFNLNSMINSYELLYEHIFYEKKRVPNANISNY